MPKTGPKMNKIEYLNYESGIRILIFGPILGIFPL